MTGRKVCARCGKPKSRSAFYGNRSASDGKQSICKQCNTDDVRERYWRRRLRTLTAAEIETELQRANERLTAITSEIERREAE